MKKLLIAVVLLNCCGNQVLLAQEDAIKDSLYRIVLTAPDDSFKVFALYKYGELFETSNPDSATWYFEQGRALSKKLNYKKGLAASASYYIVVLNNQGKFKEALELAKEALAIFEETGSKRDMAVGYINVGSEWQYLSDLQAAAEHYLKAKNISDEIKDKRLQRIANNNLSSIFNSLGQYEKGKDYAGLALVLARDMQDDYAIASSTINIASAESYMKKYAAAIQQFREVEQLGIKMQDEIIKMDGWLGIADNYKFIERYDSSEKYYLPIIELSRSKNYPEYEMYGYMGLSELYVKTRQYAKAGSAITKGIELAVQLGSKIELKDLYLRASELNESAGNLSKALDFRKKFEKLNDSLINEKSSSAINLAEAKYASQRKQGQINELEAQRKIQDLHLRQKTVFNYIFAGSAVALLAIALLSYRSYRQKQVLNQQRISELEKEKHLLAAEAVLKGQEQERSRLAKDLHDSLGGMLSGIKHSFSNMKGNLVMTPENIQAFERGLDMLDTSISEFRRVAHNMMPDILLKFGLNAAIRDYCSGLNNSGDLKIVYQSYNLENFAVDETIAITLYRVIQELVTNVIKHAKATEAVVQVSRENNKLLITVEDNGNGFDTSLLDRARGIGWSNIKSRIEYLQGEIDIQSGPGKGTSINIEINV
jgi:signal transduction histidine kinase